MDVGGNDELRSVWKNVLIIFLFWVILNHTVAFLTPRVSPSGSWLAFVGVTTLRSVDKFRSGTGDFIGKAENICPDVIQGYCHTGMDVLKDVLGVG